jgi:hypothetical protein
MDYEEARKQESVKDLVVELSANVERYIFIRIVTDCTDKTFPPKIEATATSLVEGEETVVVDVDIDGLDLAEHHDLAAVRLARKLGWIGPKRYLLRAVTNWGDVNRGEMVLKGFTYITRERGQL